MADNNAPVTREEFEALQKQLADLQAQTVTKDDFTSLEGAVNTTLEAVAKKATTSSVTVEKPEDKPKVIAPKSFDLKGVGKVKLKFPSFQIGKKKYSCAEVEKDAKLAAELYASNPGIFVNVKNE